MGIDAPGLLQVVYKMIGVKLPRNSADQAKVGTDVGFLDQAKVGDLAFFEGANGLIAHCGIILEDKKIIHVHGMVKVDDLDHQGIYDRDRKKYLYPLRTIRNVLPLDS